jgi:hypothetical protein
MADRPCCHPNYYIYNGYDCKSLVTPSPERTALYSYSVLDDGRAWLLMLIDFVEIPKGGEESCFEDLSLIVGQETDFNWNLE